MMSKHKPDMSCQNQNLHRKTSEIVKVLNRRPKKQIKPSMVMSSTGWEPCVYVYLLVIVCPCHSLLNMEKGVFFVQNVQEGDSRTGDQKHQ